MILIWCLCGIIAAYCIGRYNQSNKLFWVLFTSFILGIAGAAVYNKCTATNQDEIRSTQVYPTQDVSVTNTTSVTIVAEEAMCENMPALVSQDYTPESSGSISLWTQWVKSPLVPPPIPA